MQISFSPFRSDEPLTVSRSGDALTINGEVFDFTPLTEGASLPMEAVGCPWIISDVERISGEIHLTLLLPHGAIPFPAPPEADAVLYPAPIQPAIVGSITLPSYTPAEEIEQ